MWCEKCQRGTSDSLTCGSCGNPPLFPMEQKDITGTSSLDCGGSINHNKEQSILPNLRDLHNRSVKFIITKDFKVDWRQRKGFKSLVQDVSFKGFKLTKGKNYLIVYNDKRHLTDEKGLIKADEEIVNEMTDIAKQVSKENDFEINPTPIFHRIEVKTDMTMNKFTDEESQVVYNTPYNNLEFKGKFAIPNSMNLNQILLLLNQTVVSWNENVISHLEATNRWEKAAQSIIDSQPRKSNPILMPLTNLLNTAIKLKEEFE